jgi:molybdate transport system substrate-binding protein
MRKHLSRAVVLLGLAAMITACSGEADSIRVLSAGPLEAGLATLAAAYKAETGRVVTIETGTTPVVRERLEAGEMFDVVIATRAVVDAAAARGQLDASGAPEIGRVGIGIAVREGVDVPAAQNAAELKALLLIADSVAYNQGSSGVYVQSMIASLGIAAEISARTTQYANGTQVLTHVREGKGKDLGLAPLTEIQANAPDRIRMIPLPADVQNYTVYYAAVSKGAARSAADFVQFLTTAEARKAFAATAVN